MRLSLFRRHVVDHLAAFDDGQLEPGEAARVQSHLAQCAHCRAQLADVRRARQLLQALPNIAMPAHEVSRLRDALRERLPSRRRRMIPLTAAAACAALAIAGVLIYRQFAPLPLELIEAQEPAGLERVASDLHDQFERGGATLEFETADPVRIRDWQLTQGAAETRLASPVVAVGQPDIRLHGASIVETGGVRASLVRYAVDGRSATLVTARHADVASAPEDAWLVKRVYVRHDGRGHRALVWSSSGQTYAIVSDLAGTGMAACLVCHADQTFRQRLDRVVAK